MSYPSRTTLALTGAAVLAVGSMLAGMPQASAQNGDDKTEAAIKYRQSVMSTMGGLMGTTVGQLRDGFEYGPDLEAVASALQAASNDIPALFPEGTDSGDTRALPAVWNDREAFREDATELADSAEAFAQAVNGGDRREIFKAFKAVGDSCKSCHEDFREEKD